MPQDTETKLKPIENKIKFKKSINREEIQEALDSIAGQGLSPDSKIQILKSMVGRTGVKKIGIRTLMKPRDEVEEVDNTYAFIGDIFSYRGVIEKEE